MPCDAHRSWKKGDCPSCGSCRCCPPASDCDPELGRHTCSVSSPTATCSSSAGNKGGKKKPASSSKKKRAAAPPAAAAAAPAPAGPNPGIPIPPPPGPSDQQLYRGGDVVFAEDKSNMLWEAVVKNCRLQPIGKKKSPSPSSFPSSSAAAAGAGATHEWKYLVHYQGWNARWDRWTDGSDLRPDDPPVRAEARRRHDEAAERERERKARQREKRELQKLSSAASSPAAATAAAAPSSASSSSSRKRKKSADGSGGIGGGGSDGAASGGKGRRGASPAASKMSKQGSGAVGMGVGSTGGRPRSRSAKSAGPPSREDVQSTLEACCALPFTLRTILVDDKATIARLGRCVASGYDDVRSVPNWTPPRMVHVLPSALPVNVMIKRFWKERKKSIKDKAKAAVIRMAKTKEREEGSDYSDLEADDIAGIKERQAAEEIKWKTFLQGLLDLFDDALAPFLLYSQERTHYLAAKMDPNVLKGGGEDGDGFAAPSGVYGGEHLLRLFVRLPQIVASSSADNPLFPHRASLTSFADCMSDLIVHLQKNRDACFKGRYREPTEIEWTWEEAEIVKQCATRDTSTADEE